MANKINAAIASGHELNVKTSAFILAWVRPACLTVATITVLVGTVGRFAASGANLAIVIGLALACIVLTGLIEGGTVSMFSIAHRTRGRARAIIIAIAIVFLLISAALGSLGWDMLFFPIGGLLAAVLPYALPACISLIYLVLEIYTLDIFELQEETIKSDGLKGVVFEQDNRNYVRETQQRAFQDVINDPASMQELVGPVLAYIKTNLQARLNEEYKTVVIPEPAAASGLLNAPAASPEQAEHERENDGQFAEVYAEKAPVSRPAAPIARGSQRARNLNAKKRKAREYMLLHPRASAASLARDMKLANSTARDWRKEFLAEQSAGQETEAIV